MTTEFATWTPPPTRNPVRPDRTPGGSSSGSAAAVAAGMAPLALGTQTVGSTIRPAAFCGIAGLKPTHGVASLRGVMLHSDELDTLGLMARDARSLAALWRAVAGAPAAAAPLSRPPRVAAVRTPWWDRAGDASRRAFERAADALRAGGAQVRERTLPPGFAAVSDAHRTVTEHDVARGLASHAEDPRLSPLLRVLVERGLAVSAAERAAAVETGRAAARDLEPLWAEFDALLVPAVVGEAPPAAEGTGDAIHCVPWSLLGTPAVTVPAGVGPEGLPVGIQLVAPRGRDLALLEVAALAHA